MPRFLQLNWALARARAMSPAEFAWRAERTLRARSGRILDRMGLAGGKPPLDRVVADPELAGEALLFGRRPRSFLPAENEDRLGLARSLSPAAGAAAPPEEARESSGDRHLPETASPPGVSPILQSAVDWNRDPVTGRSFPLLHWSAIDYRQPEDEGAIRRLWYLGRHLDLTELALPYYLAGERQAAELVAGHLRSWIEQCPPYRGVHWLVPLELALRLIAWSYSARLLAGSAALGELAPALGRSVHLQAEHILAHLSAHSSANNHLIAQAAGLVHAGSAFSGLRRAALWRETGREIIWREILRQTTEDGVSREVSTHYQELVLELGLLVWLSLRASGEEPPGQVRKRLTEMLAFVAELESFPGGAPDLGDSDNQSAMPLGAGAPPRQTLLGLGSVLVDRGDWKALTRGLTRPAAFLLGETGRGRYASLATERPTIAASRLYREGGYALLRDASGDRAALLDCGELGYLSTAAHGHADCLSIVLGAFGEPLLIDPGTYTYHAEPRFRQFFRSTAAHNTLRVDGLEQSEMLGAFLWGRRANARFVDWVSLGAIDLVVGEHDGYERLAEPVTHRRSLIFVKPDYLWVVDELSGDGEHLVEAFFHLPRGAAVDGERAGEVLALSPSGVTLTLLALGQRLPELDLFTGSERPLQGWCSPVFGQLFPAPVLRFAGSIAMPATLHFLLRPLAEAGRPSGENEEREEARIHALSGGEALAVRGMPGEDLVLLGPGQGIIAGPGSLAGDVQLDGEMGLVRANENRIVAIAGRRLRRLAAAGRELVELEEGEPADFCLRRLGDRAVVEGTGGRFRVWGEGIQEVRSGGARVRFERSGDWIIFNLEP